MAAEMKVSEWVVVGVAIGDITVRADEEYVKINQGDEHAIWLYPTDVPAMIEALQAATA